MLQKTLPDTFREMAQRVLANYPELAHEWTSGAGGKLTLKFPAATPEGFDIEIQCEKYGLYPFAGGWHGSPWESMNATMTPASLCEDCLGFIRSVLCADSRLEVRYSNGRPFRWTLTFPLEGKRESEQVGLLFYNYFGKRTIRTFVNEQLPPRESSPSYEPPNNRMQRSGSP